MADDLDAFHEIVMQTADDLVVTIGDTIVQSGYLPCISGGEATWILRTAAGGQPLAVMAQQWDAVRVLSASPRSLGALPDREELQVYVEYCCQVDPDLVYDALEGRRPLPDRYGRSVSE